MTRIIAPNKRPSGMRSATRQGDVERKARQPSVTYIIDARQHPWAATPVIITSAQNTDGVGHALR